MAIISIILGLIILYLGGETLIKAAVSVARHLNISKFLVSSVIVGFGTSMPEMTISVDAMLQNTPEIAVGNVIGSNITNILLILGIAAMITPFSLQDRSIKRDIVAMLMATIVFSLFAFLNTIGFFHGLLLLTILVAYIIYSYIKDKESFSTQDAQDLLSDIGCFKNLNFPLSILLSVLGIVLLVTGSSLFLEGSIAIANQFNISKEIIGLGIVAAGSCLPELAAAIVASIRRQGNIVIASIVGSNIFNILSIMGVVSMIDDIKTPQHILKFDLWVFLSVSLLLAYMLLTNIKFSRKVGAAFFISYILYVLLLFHD